MGKSDPRALGSQCIEGTEESFPGVDSSVPSIHRDSSDLGSMIHFRIFPKKPKYKLKYIFESANKSKNPKKEKAFKLSMEGLIGLMYVSHSPNREAVVARSATPP